MRARIQKLIIGVLISIFVAAGFSDFAYADFRAAEAFAARRDYESAAAAFFQAYGYPKNAAEKVKAEWGLALSLQHLGLYYSASKYYSVIVRRGRKANNPFFRTAMEQLGQINSTVPLGQSHIVQLFKTQIDSASVPGPARGFYFYYLGIEAFNQKKFEIAASHFSKVPSNSPYYIKALFHLGVVSNLSGAHSKAISYFEKVREAAPHSDKGDYLREISSLNIARVFYETKKFSQSMKYYADIPRDSDNWLESIFESAWAFFLMQKHNNTLGQIHTIHAPFFDNRFFPESYILQAITFLRLCRYNEVKLSLKEFKDKYQPVFNDLRTMLKNSGSSNSFFKLVYDYQNGSINKYKNAWAILDFLARTDSFKEANITTRFVDGELARLSRFRKLGSSGLLDELKSFLSAKKSLAVSDAGKRLFDNATGLMAYLRELSNQTKFINAEMLMGKVDALRAKLKIKTAEKKANFIGGMQPLKLGQSLEYWPFDGEYWEDELGSYVYNLESKCKTEGGKDKADDDDNSE